MADDRESTPYERNPRVLWRVLPGVVLTQMLDAEPGAGASELSGVAAQVWVVLDEPMRAADIAEVLESTTMPNLTELVGEALAQLHDAGLVIRG